MTSDQWIFHHVAGKPGGGRAFLKRRDTRVTSRDVPVSDEVQPAQFAALQEWAKPTGERLAYLKEIKIPVLIVGGKADNIF